MTLLNGKTAIVTGASRGIGRQIALTLARNKAAVVVQATNEDRLSALVGEIELEGGTAVAMAGDVAHSETAASVVDAAMDRFGAIDILVNNAGINLRGSTLDMSIVDWQRVLDVNLTGTLHFCRAVLPGMIAAKGGKIVNVSSSTAKSGHKNAAPAYGASKAAVNYLTIHLAQEMAEHGIYVNAVCPGPVETDMVAEWSDAYRETVLARVPLGRLGTAANIADIVLFLASSQSDFITGETINANGGTYMN